MWPARATVGRQPSRCVCNLGGFFMSKRRSGLRAKADQSAAETGEDAKSSAPPAGISSPYLPALGVYGFGEIEPVILAALITEDPLLLIGASGTGKTYLLNSLSEA